MTPTDLIETRPDSTSERHMHWPVDPDTTRRLQRLTLEVRERWWRR